MQSAFDETLLDGLRVVDLTGATGLLCGALLGMLGADVIYIDAPQTAYAQADHKTRRDDLLWMAYGVNRRSVALDFGRDRALFEALVRSADVVITAADVSRLNELGLGVDNLRALRSDLIVTTISPFGLTGPRAHWKASDLVCAALSGQLFASGSSAGPPTRVSRIPQTDLQAGLDAAWATVAALLGRSRTGDGAHVDVSATEAMARCALQTGAIAQFGDPLYEAAGEAYAVAPYSLHGISNMWKVQDGFVTLGIYLGEQGNRRQPRLVRWMYEEGFAPQWLLDLDWASFDWPDISIERREEIREPFARFFASKTQAELLAGAVERNVMIQPEHSFAAVLDHVQLAAREFWSTFSEADQPDLRYPGGFCRPSSGSCELRRPAPAPGAHTGEVLAELTIPELRS